ncbi:MAG: MATE family efflux transporter [Eubacteriales bacterium]|nr:MATE family efflux transporter [Eubacteriales bacterium]
MAKQKNSIGDFTQGSVQDGILRLAGPMILAQIVGVLYNIVDRMFIGHHPELGKEALTGLGILFPLVTLFIAFANWAGQGGAAIFAIERGHGDDQKAAKIQGNALFFLLSSALLLGLISYLFENPILHFFGATDSSYRYAGEYLRIYLLGVPFNAISLGLNPFISAQGYPKKGMLTVIIGAVLNLILDPLLIYYFQLGIKGAAIATVISQAVSAIWILHFLSAKKTPVRLSHEALKPRLAVLTQILTLGFANFIFQLTNSLTLAVANTTLLRYGGDLHLGVMTVIISIRQMFSMPINGLAVAAKPFLSFNYGAEMKDRVVEGIKYVTKICAVLTILTTAIIFAVPQLLLSLFNSDPQFISAGVLPLRIYFSMFFFMSFQMVGQSTFTALGMAKEASFFSLLRKVFLILPLTLLLPKLSFLGVFGVYLAEALSQLIGGTACYLTMWKRVVKSPR